MSYNAYWFDPMDILLSYYKKWELEKEAENLRRDADAWLIGAYVQLAVSSIFSKDVSYPSKPKSLEALEVKTEEEIRTETFLQLDSWKRATVKNIKADKER